MHPSHQAQSSSKQKVNSAPPSSAISEERGGKENGCTERQNQEMPCPKISSAWGTKTRSEEGHSQAETPWTWQVAGQPAPARTVPASSLLSATHPSRLQPTPRSTSPQVCHAKETRSLSPTQHHSSSSPSLTPLPPRGQEHWGVPGSHTQLFHLNPQAEAASCSLCTGSTSLVQAGIHTHHSKPHGTSFPLDSGRACLTSHTNKASPHQQGAALIAVKCRQGHRANPAVRERQICAPEACIAWAKAETRKMLPEHSKRRVKCLYRPERRTARAQGKKSTRQGLV